MDLLQVRDICSHITMDVLGTKFGLLVEIDKVYGCRMFMQTIYKAPCTKTGEVKEWKSGKNYLSSYMTEDEIVKRAFATLKQAVDHEIMEGFKYDNTIVFNPHVSFKELLKISSQEVTRDTPIN